MKLAGYEKTHSTLVADVEKHQNAAVSGLMNAFADDPKIDRKVLTDVVLVLIHKPALLREIKLAAQQHGVLYFLEANAK